MFSGMKMVLGLAAMSVVGLAGKTAMAQQYYAPAYRPVPVVTAAYRVAPPVVYQAPVYYTVPAPVYCAPPAPVQRYCPPVVVQERWDSRWDWQQRDRFERERQERGRFEQDRRGHEQRDRHDGDRHDRR